MNHAEESSSEILSLISLLPDPLDIWASAFVESLVEIIVDLGKPFECRLSNGTSVYSSLVITSHDIKDILRNPKLSPIRKDNRASVQGTLHRVSAIYDLSDNVVGLTLRVGKHIQSNIKLIADILDSDESVLFVGPPGFGKTTYLRQAACYLSTVGERRVMIVDTSNEIGGDCTPPHAAVGNARRLMVPERTQQYKTMLEAVQNHNPQVVIVDEISDRNEARACQTIASRGVTLLASAHGKSLSSIIDNYEINVVLGSIVDATISDENAKKQDGNKVSLHRRNAPAFTKAIEIVDFNKIKVYPSVQRYIDNHLKGEDIRPEERSIDSEGNLQIKQEVTITDEQFPLKDKLSAFSGRL
jgi:stage III sporulation protein SpoIIIAA